MKSNIKKEKDVKNNNLNNEKDENKYDIKDNNNSYQENNISQYQNSALRNAGIFSIPKILLVSAVIQFCNPIKDQTTPKKRNSTHKNNSGTQHSIQGKKQFQQCSNNHDYNLPKRKKRRVSLDNSNQLNSQTTLNDINSSSNHGFGNNNMSKTCEPNNTLLKEIDDKSKKEMDEKSKNDLNSLEQKIYSFLTNRQTIDTQLLINCLKNHNQGIIPYLLKHPNVDPFFKDENGDTILHKLVSIPGFEQEASIFINSLKNNDFTYLTLKSISSAPDDILKEITSFTGSFFNIENKEGKTPLDICNNLQLKILLKRSGAFYSENVLEERIKKVFKHKNILYNKGDNISITQKLIRETIEDGDIDAVWIFMCHHSFKNKDLANLFDQHKTELDRCSSLYEKVEKIVSHSVPYHQIANIGLNVRVYCDNKECSRSILKNGFWLDKSVIIDLSSKKDGGDVFISRYVFKKVKCPCCFKIFRIDGVGFRNCKAKGCLEKIINRNRMPTSDNLIPYDKPFFAEDSVIYFRSETGEYNTRFFELVY